MEIFEVAKQLEVLPGQVYKEATEAENLKVVWETAKRELKREEAKCYLELKVTELQKSSKLRLTDTNLKYKVENNETVFMLHIDCIQKESNYKQQLLKTSKLENDFTAMKRIAQIQMTIVNNGIEYPGIKTIKTV